VFFGFAGEIAHRLLINKETPMASVSDKLDDLKRRMERELAMGGDERIQKQHKDGKLTARERLDLFFDPGTFRERVLSKLGTPVSLEVRLYPNARQLDPAFYCD